MGEDEPRGPSREASRPARRDPLGLIGTTLDRRYEVTRLVAEGGFGVVYEAQAIALGVRVAIKVLREEMLGSAPGVRERFDQEAKLLARLRHPAIVKLLDASHVDGTPFLVLEWIEGETLDARVERTGPLTVGDTQRLLGPVADAIAYAHRQGVIHRDLKPANVMIGIDGPHVLDFGVARWAHPNGVQTTTLSTTGLSVGYAAPEQYGKDFGPIDVRVDVFALAALVFAALTATPPFAGGSIAEVMFATCISAERPTLRTARPELAECLDPVLQKALAILPTNRHPSIGAFWDALLGAARANPSILETCSGPAHSQDALDTDRDPTGPRPDPRDTPLQPPQGTLASPPVRPLHLGLAPTERAPLLGAPRAPLVRPPAGDIGAIAHVPPPSESPPSREASAVAFRRIVGMVALGVMVGALAVAARPLLVGPRAPQPVPKLTVSAVHAKPSRDPPALAPSGSALGARPSCGTKAPTDSEACILGARTTRGPDDCRAAENDPWLRQACPREVLEVPTFVLDRDEVSIGRYQVCVDARKCRPLASDAPDLPARGVTHADAVAFCTFEHKRLPTDAEWELAAAGPVHRAFPWGNESPTPKEAVFSSVESTRTGPLAVGSLAAGMTVEGVLELAGNVAEWTSTIASASAPPATGLLGSAEGGTRGTQSAGSAEGGTRGTQFCRIRRRRDERGRRCRRHQRGRRGFQRPVRCSHITTILGAGRIVCVHLGRAANVGQRGVPGSLCRSQHWISLCKDGAMSPRHEGEVPVELRAEGVALGMRRRSAITSLVTFAPVAYAGAVVLRESRSALWFRVVLTGAALATANRVLPRLDRVPACARTWARIGLAGDSCKRCCSGASLRASARVLFLAPLDGWSLAAVGALQ